MTDELITILILGVIALVFFTYDILTLISNAKSFIAGTYTGWMMFIYRHFWMNSVTVLIAVIGLSRFSLVLSRLVLSPNLLPVLH